MNKNYIQPIFSSKLMKGLILGSSLVLTTSCSKASHRIGMFKPPQTTSVLSEEAMQAFRRHSYNLYKNRVGICEVEAPQTRSVLSEEAMRTFRRRPYNIYKNREDYTPDGYTALHKAAENGHLDVVEVLLKEGAKVNTQDKNGWTPLHKAAENGHTKIVELLLQHSAKIDAIAQDPDQRTVVFFSYKDPGMYIKTQEQLNSISDYLNLQDKFLKTALDLAKENKQSECIDAIEGVNRFALNGILGPSGLLLGGEPCSIL